MILLRVGDVLDGSYRIDRLLGVGGVGAVYAATHLTLSHQVAVKVLHAQFAGMTDALERFQSEAKILGGLKHPSIVAVKDFAYTADGVPYLVMELLVGRSLRERLERSPLSVDEMLRVLRPICDALQKVHERGILHRDLKPDNLMVLDSGDVKILDFGMAKFKRAPKDWTDPGMVMGTANYLAPERVRGKAAEVASDIFSLGLIVWEMLKGRMAYSAEEPVATMYQILEHPVPPLDLPDPRISRSLDWIIARACARSPADRYQECATLYAALEQAVQTHSSGNELLPELPRWTPPEPDFPPDGRLVKALTVRATLEFVRVRFGVEGYRRLQQEVGVERLRRLHGTVLTAWVDAVELDAIHEAIVRLFDDGSRQVLRDLGRYVANVALATIYKSLLSDAGPEASLRRFHRAAPLLVRPAEVKVQELSAGQWSLEMRGWAQLSPAWLAARAGWLSRYLELCGATAVRADEALWEEEGKAVGRLVLNFQPPV